jgi:hypothetical protein
MNIKTTFTALRKAEACTEGYRKLAKHLGGITKYGKNTPIPVSVILNSNGLNDALWVLRNAASGDVKPVVVQWACDCAERVLSIWETKYPDDSRPRDAINAARAWLANPCGETRQAAYAAYVAYGIRAAARAAAYAADAARAAAYAAERAAYATDSAVYAADAAADAAAYTAADAAAYVAERDWQINRLKELLK